MLTLSDVHVGDTVRAFDAFGHLVALGTVEGITAPAGSGSAWQDFATVRTCGAGFTARVDHPVTLEPSGTLTVIL